MGSVLTLIFAFLIGQLVSMASSFLEPTLLNFDKPGRILERKRSERGESQWPSGTLDELRQWVRDALPGIERGAPDVVVDRGYVWLQQHGNDTHARMVKQQMTFHRNMAVACMLTAIASALRAFLDEQLWFAVVAIVFLGAIFPFIWRFRRFARSFVIAVLEGVALSPSSGRG